MEPSRRDAARLDYIYSWVPFSLQYYKKGCTYASVKIPILVPLMMTWNTIPLMDGPEAGARCSHPSQIACFKRLSFECEEKSASSVAFMLTPCISLSITARKRERRFSGRGLGPFSNPISAMNERTERTVSSNASKVPGETVQHGQHNIIFSNFLAHAWAYLCYLRSGTECLEHWVPSITRPV